MNFILWIAAVALVLYGLYRIFKMNDVAIGIVLVIVGLALGPGGYSIINR